MSNDRIDDRADQPCTGPEGHVPPDDAGMDFSAIVPTFPDVRLITRPALIGERCTGIYSTIAHEWGGVSPGPHLAAIAVSFDPPRRQAPHAFVEGTPGEPGEVIRDGRNGDGLSRADRQHLVDAFQAVIEGAVGPLRPVRRREPWDWPREDYLQVWRELRATYRGRDLVRALTERCGVTERTIANWHDRYGYPVHEPLETFGTFPDNEPSV